MAHWRLAWFSCSFLGICSSRVSILFSYTKYLPSIIRHLCLHYYLYHDGFNQLRHKHSDGIGIYFCFAGDKKVIYYLLLLYLLFILEADICTWCCSSKRFSRRMYGTYWTRFTNIWERICFIVWPYKNIHWFLWWSFSIDR